MKPVNSENKQAYRKFHFNQANAKVKYMSNMQCSQVKKLSSSFAVPNISDKWLTVQILPNCSIASKGN